MENVYLGRQPILDSKGDLVAYEILYRDSAKASHISNDRFASASVISNILNKFGTSTLLGNRRAFVKVDEKFLLHDIIFSIPKEFFIFSLFEDVEMSERVVERLQQLHAKDYVLAINDISLDSDTLKEYSKVYKELSYIKINVDKDIDFEMKAMISEMKAHNIKVVGSKIEDNAHYILAKEIGCDMFQGYFFAKPNIVENAKYEPSQLNVLKLYNLLINDTNIDEITSEFENNYEITVQLLRYMNSCAFHFRNRISSVHHILTLVGRQPLAQWLMLMIYSKSVSRTSKHSPLMLMVKNRTELMENILKAVNPDVKSNALGEAYFVGVLSLIDTLFSVKLERILADLNISDEVTNALLKDEGLLGEIYALIRDIEAFDTKSVHIFTSKYNLGTHQIEDVVLKCMEEVTTFEEAMTA
ncbi:EAL and HDOD domain-containing protein [Sulfurimonas sp.]|uniref:EAL and HDOD domain-containing protein n=1 Tax=Sulfurimonas sp. TaxID=2022749 RepID=UPI00356367CD